MTNGKDFPNNWQFVHDADDDQFTPCSYDEFDEISSMWSLNSSHCCIMRVENTDTGKVKEHAYKRMSNALKKLTTLADDPANVITVCDDHSIHFLIHPDNEHYPNE